MRKIYDAGQVGRTETVFEYAPYCEKYGVDAINITSRELASPETFREADQCVKAHGLSWGMLPMPMDAYSEDLSDEDFAKGLETLKRWADITADSDGKHCYNHIWNGSNARTYDAQRECLLERARRVFEVLDPYGVHYGFEFLGVEPLRKSFRYPFFNDLTGALSIADEISPRMGFVFDTYHWYTGSDCDMGDLYYAAAHIDRLVNFHVNDGIAGVPREKQEDMERAMPMTTGVINSRIPYELFKKRGYEGLILCEPMTIWRNEMKDQPLEEVVKALAEGYARLEEG